ncbi:alpha-L-fucosidase [Streptomyces sp. NPDC021225]|uniref:alpha-L-fucosidase n=1 Tax=Streptomyces sp. NPDC021225 TaxID=3365121 RepID=UPI0037A07C07
MNLFPYSRKSSLRSALTAAAITALTGLAALPPAASATTTTTATTAATAATATETAAGGAAGCQEPVTPAPVMAVEECDSPARIIEKAANIVPRPSQVAWQQRGIIGFTHFGMNTFTDREWGSGMEKESRFAPPDVDVAQWMRAYRGMGAKQVIFTAKHHDGFVLYPTRYSGHSVIASPWWVSTTGCERAEEATAARTAAERERDTDPAAYWRARKAGCERQGGDILGTYVSAARAAGLRVGVYLSPSDGAELPPAWHRDTYIPAIEAKPAGSRSTAEKATLEDAPASPAGHGRYGDSSKPTARTIPTLVPGDDRTRAVAQGTLPVFDVTADDYNAYYLNQLYELFTQYGPIDELWLDGANPWAGSGISETYDFTTWFKMIKALSPDTVVFAGPQGTRWVGNEAGVARTSEWSVTPATGDPDTAHNEGLIPGGAWAQDIGSRTVLARPDVRYLQWFPAEADSSIRPGWFYHPGEQPQSAAELVGKYQQSVGRNAVMLLNAPPGTNGRIADSDLAHLTSFGTAIRDTYRTNLLAPQQDATGAALTDEDLSTGWSPAGQATTGSVTLNIPQAQTFDQILLRENITRGQRIEEFAIDTWNGTTWTQAASGTTIGYSRILRLDASVRTDRIRVRVQAARATPQLATVGLYRTVTPTTPKKSGGDVENP